MKSSLRNKIMLLLIDVIIITLCAFGILQIIKKADLPISVGSENSLLVVKRNDLSTVPALGDKIISINNIPVNTIEEEETLLSGFTIGQSVDIKTINNKTIKNYKLILTNYYSKTYVIAASITGYLFILIGIIVLLKCYEKMEAKIFHAVSIATGIIILMTPGNYNTPPLLINYLDSSLFNLAYTFVPITFIYFTLSFPSGRFHLHKNLIIFAYLIASFISVLIIISFFKMTSQVSASTIRNYISFFNIGRVLMVLSVLTGIIIFMKSYINADSSANKKRLKWLLYGFALGPLSYVIFWVIPQTVTGVGIIPEEIVIILMSAVPITFAISIIKYHLLDIDLIINRSFVYAIVISFLILLYIMILSTITFLVQGVNKLIPSIAAGVIIAILLNPLRNKVQSFVDKKFFRVQYDFKTALKNFLTRLKESDSINSLANKIIIEIDKLINVKKIGFFILLKPANRIKLIAHKNFDILINRTIRFEFENLKSDLSLPVAVRDKVERGVINEIADNTVFNRWGIVLVFPIKSLNGEFFAFLVLGSKKSEAKFTAEDVDLLITVVSNASETIERINLQENLIRKRLEAERLEELNRMKSLFVSTVSHDLKTPLTSIKIFTEILQNDDKISGKNHEYLNIIDGETDRLTRLIDNVLEFSKIEQGIKKYNIKPTDVNELIKDVLKVIQYQIQMQKFTVNLFLTNEKITIDVDRDAVTQTLINLISNSIKYSHEKKIITITSIVNNKNFKIKIEDYGIGISKEDLKSVFEPFFRSKDNQVNKIAGTGLGLTIVKNLMDVHKGSVEIKSELNKGSTFTLNFPIKSL